MPSITDLDGDTTTFLILLTDLLNKIQSQLTTYPIRLNYEPHDERDLAVESQPCFYIFEAIPKFLLFGRWFQFGEDWHTLLAMYIPLENSVSKTVEVVIANTSLIQTVETQLKLYTQRYGVRFKIKYDFAKH